MEAVTAVRYVKSVILAGVTGERIYERTQEKRPLARPIQVVIYLAFLIRL
jgi:hypothetical protein